MIMLPNGTPAEWTDLAALIRDRANRTPDVLAIEVDGKTLTYGELHLLSDCVAGNLAAKGVDRGDRVATMLFNCMEQVLTFFGTAKLGAIWTPLNVSLAGDDLAHVLSDSGPKVIIAEAETEERVAKAAVKAGHPLIFVVGHAAAGEARAFDELMQPLETALPILDIAPSDPASIIYTGGTTGLPKGVVLPHFAWIAAGYRYVEAFEITPADRHYSILPMFHVGGSMIGLLGPLVAGIPTHFERWFSATKFWPRVKETGATVIDPIGTMVSVLCRAPETPRDADNTVRVSLATLSQVPKDVVESFPRRFGLGLVNVYSLTEVGGTLIVHNKADTERPEANGKPWGWCELSIRDAADRALPAGQSGEICLRPTVPHTFMIEYYNNPAKTIETWRNLWIHTGDIGYLDEDGYLFFTGRQAHWLRVKGENVSAYEVENTASNYPGVAEVIVVGVPADLGDEDVKAFIIRDADATIDPADFAAWCGERLAPFKVPRYVQFVDEFPRSATKREVERHKLRDMPANEVWDAGEALGRRGNR